MQFLPIVSAVGATGTSKSAATVSMCQTLSTPLSFWEYQYNSNNTSNFVVSPCTARTSQIIAEGVVIDNLNKEDNTAKISRLSASDVSFTIKCAPIDVDALRSTEVVAKAGSGNVFLANDCLIALRPIQEGEQLAIDPATIDVYQFMALPEASRVKLVGFTEPSLRAHLSSEIKMPVVSVCPKLDVRRSEAIGEALRAISQVEAGETLYDFSKAKMSILPFATMYTICVSNGVHMLVDGGSQCLAHSCDPNTKIVIDDVKGSLKVVALKEIKPDDVVSFNYLSTEWSMDCPFDCACGSPKCFGRIAGFRHLKREHQDKLLADSQGSGVSPTVLALLQESRKLINSSSSVTSLRYAAPHDFARGSILAVHVSETEQRKLFFTSSNDDDVVISGTVHFPFCDLNPSEDAQLTFDKMFPSSDVPIRNEENYDHFQLPSAALVGSSIIALRDIKKGEFVTMRRVIIQPKIHIKDANDDDDLIREEAVPSFIINENFLQRISAHIINVDVMQTFDGLPIATNKASLEERGGIPHYFMGKDVISFRSSSSSCCANKNTSNIHDFVTETTQLIREIRENDFKNSKNHHSPRLSLIVLCGGTLYYQLALLVKGASVIENDDDDDESEDENDDREEVDGDQQQQNSSSSKQNSIKKLDWSLWNKLNEINPQAASRFHPNDTRRLERQIEIALASKSTKKITNNHEAAGGDDECNKKLELRDFSVDHQGARSDIPQQPIVLWFHQGLNRRSFIEKLNKRVDKMVQLGLFHEALYHSIVKVLNDIDDDDDDREMNTTSLNFILAKAKQVFPTATTGVESAIGFKEIIASLISCVEKKMEELGIHQDDDLTTWNQDQIATFVQKVLNIIHPEQDPSVQQGLDRMKTATWRYAVQQDHWLRQRFYSQLHQEKNLLKYLILILEHPSRSISKSYTATIATLDALTKSTRNDVGVFDSSRVFEKMNQQLAIAAKGMSKEKEISSTFIKIPRSKNISTTASVHDDSTCQLFRCDSCDKAIVGIEQWKIHLSTKAHKRNEKRVEPTEEQIEKWKVEGEKKRNERRRERQE